jgi:glycosyltransferase involved in cell wall biosynthesis
MPDYEPLVSVIMPVYNAEKYLLQAIESILCQDYRNLEMIVINDGSTDNSKNIISTIRDPRLSFFENPENWGIVRSRNRGLEEAKGEYIAILDSDDLAFPERIRTQVTFLENNPDYGMCGTYFQTIDGNDKILKKVTFPSNDKDAKSNLLVHNCFCHSTIMMRGDLARELKYTTGYDVVEDYLLWYRISLVSKIINLPVYTTYYRVHANNVSTTRNNHMFGLVKSINSTILNDLGIEYSAVELEVHSKSLHYDFDYFNQRGRMAELENWILKLLSKVKTNQNINEIIVYRILAEKWIVLCNQTRTRKRMFFNKLVFLHPDIYLKTLYRKISKNI